MGAHTHTHTLRTHTHTCTHTYTHLYIYTQLINQSGLKLFKEAETAFTVVGVQGGAAERQYGCI